MNLDLLLEAERRGILPPEKKALLDEARSRGLVGGVSTNSEAVGELQNKLKAMAAGGVNTLSLGLADEATGLIEGVKEAPGEGTFVEGYTRGRDSVRGEHERLKTEEPAPYLGGQIAGGVAGGFVPGAGVATLGRGAGTVGRVGASAAGGAALGGIYGFGEGEGKEDSLSRALMGAGLGAGVGAATTGLGAAIQKYLDSRAGKAAVAAAPSADDLTASSQAAFARADQSAPIPRASFADAVEGIADQTRAAGRHPALTPRAQAVMDELVESSDLNRGTGIGFSEMEVLRRQAQSPAGLVTDKAEQNVGSAIIRGIDDFMDNSPDMGPAAKEARDLWRRMRQSEMLDDAMERAARAGSGFENGIRNEFRKILNSPTKSRGLSPAVKSAMEEVISGTAGGNMLRRIGRLMGAGMGAQTNMLGAGLSSAAGASLGFASGIPGGGAIGAALPVIAGQLAQKGAQATTRNKAALVNALVRSGQTTLPVASDSKRRLIEAMTRHIGATTPQ